MFSIDNVKFATSSKISTQPRLVIFGMSQGPLETSSSIIATYVLAKSGSEKQKIKIQIPYDRFNKHNSLCPRHMKRGFDLALKVKLVVTQYETLNSKNVPGNPYLFDDTTVKGLIKWYGDGGLRRNEIKCLSKTDIPTETRLERRERELEANRR